VTVERSPRSLTAHPLTTTACGESVACALAKLEWSGARALAVVENDAVVGMVDLHMLIGVRASARRPVKVGDVMSAAVATASRSAGPPEWARLFAKE
jgi:hypothetical protein